MADTKIKSRSTTVCVIGGGSYVGSWLVRNLLRKGYSVRATLTNLGDESKTGALRGLEGAEERLQLFEGNLNEADKYEAALEGSQALFLVAVALHHDPDNSKYKDSAEASVAALKSILQACERSETVKRVIYTSSILCASPMKEDGSGLEGFLDESCWTPLHLQYDMNDYIRNYVITKSLTEKELLSYKSSKGESGLQVVSVSLALVGGETILPYFSTSPAAIISPLTGNYLYPCLLKLMQSLLGYAALVHIDDVAESHIFCMENESITGRFLCASEYVSLKEIYNHFEHKHPNISEKIERAEQVKRMIGHSNKLSDAGFKFKYNLEKIIDDSIESAKKLGVLI